MGDMKEWHEEACERATFAYCHAPDDVGLSAIRVGIAAYLAAMDAAGYVLAPKEPTRAMLLAADRHSGVTAQDYRDMLSARPRLENE